MGNRGNIVIRYDEGDTDIYLYTHWGGSELPQTLADALDSQIGRARWNDAPYLARIIFDTLTGLEGGETGYGISPYLTDNGNPILLVNTRARTIERRGVDGNSMSEAPEASWSYEDFITAHKT